jgi:hypothetical protein
MTMSRAPIPSPSNDVLICGHLLSGMHIQDWTSVMLTQISQCGPRNTEYGNFFYVKKKDKGNDKNIHATSADLLVFPDPRSTRQPFLVSLEVGGCHLLIL